MADILHIDQNKRKELERIQERLTQLEPYLGLDRDERGMSLNKAAITNGFAARRLEGLLANYPIECAEYYKLTVQEMDLMDELGIIDEIMNELFPEEWDIDTESILHGNVFQVVK